MRVFFWIIVSMLISVSVSLRAELVVGSFSSSNIKRYQVETNLFIDTFVSAGGGGLAAPHEILFAPNGNLLVCSADNDRIIAYDGYTGDFITNFVAPQSGGLDYPASMIFGPDGHLYVSSQNNDRILRYDGSTGAFIDTFVPDGSGGLNGPSGLKFGPNGNLFVTSRYGNQVIEYNRTNGSYVSTFVTNGLSQPFGLTFGSNGTLYVASGNDGLVQSYDGSTGNFLGTFASGSGLAFPVEVDFGPNGNLFVASFSSAEVLEFDGQTGVFIREAASGGGLTGPNFFTFRSPWVLQPGALQFVENDPGLSDYGWQTNLPPGFGSGEFTLELYVRLDNTFPVGPVAGGEDQRLNWYDGDPAPYTNNTWWYSGNFLLDGHNNNDFSEGTFSLQVYGGGRLRWLFGDGGSVPSGDVWAVQPWPATNSPSLLDGKWHKVSLVRRFINAGDSLLECWIDGALTASEISDVRTDMAAAYWDAWTGFPVNQEGWFWGVEKQAAIGVLSQYEDFKGMIDDVRFWNTALSSNALSSPLHQPLVGIESDLLDWMTFSEGVGSTTIGHRAATSVALTNHLWSHHNAPFDADDDHLPDWWEWAHFLHPTGAVAGVDVDGDGMSNSNEFFCGTQPTNDLSMFNIDSLQLSSNQVTLSWAATAGKRYRLQWTDNVLTGFVDTVDTWTEETAQGARIDTVITNTRVDTVSGAQRFYQLKVIQDPPE